MAGGKSDRAKNARAAKQAARVNKKSAVVVKRSNASEDRSANDEDHVDQVSLDDTNGDSNDERNDSGDDSPSVASSRPSKQSGSAAAPGKVERFASEHRSTTGVLISQPTARDVKIGNFSMISHGKDLIADTTIELTIGRRYGLIGRNGSGKSEFLKCLAKREVPIPAHIDIFYLDEEAQPTELTALEYVLARATERFHAIEQRLEDALVELGPEHELVLELTDRLEDVDPDECKVRAAKILHGLGFNKEMFNKATKDMSGGWRMRVALGEALLIRPTLLLLDEPTNHLDLEACVWLEQELATYPHCLVVVSHSQDFMNGVCTNVIHITPKHKLQVYGGNYDTFVRTRAENEANQLKQYKKEQDDIKHIKAFIASCGTYSNLVRQAKSKQKILDKMEAAGLTEKPVEEPKMRFKFPDPDELPYYMGFHNVSFSYSGKKSDHLYEDVCLSIRPDSRVALVGPNGAGKSTLLKLMIGELQPTEGEIKRHIHLKFGRYHQHSTDALDQSMPALEFIQQKYPEEKRPEEEWRGQLGRYGCTGEMQTTPMGKLSDGQKSRIVFSLIAKEKPHCLLLDEPTNHLDIECIDALAEAINQFTGGLILVSHDFRLIDQVAKEIWVCDDKKVSVWQGSIREYKQSLIKKMKQHQ